MASGRSEPRVVITGMGAVTNLGHSASATWEAMREGRSGITRIEGPEFDRYEGRWSVRVAGQVKGFEPAKWVVGRDVKRLDRFTLLGLGAAAQAVADSGIDFASEDSERCGVVVGSGVGGIQTIEDGVTVMLTKGPDRISPFTVPRLMANAATGMISIKYGLRGPGTTHVTACASSGHALGDALALMQRGRADVIVSGGAEAAVSPLCVGAFMTMKALSQRNDDPAKASRPFDRARDGFVLAEGAAMFVLETEEHARRRGAKIYAELLACGNSSDAGHITAPDPEGSGAARSMRWALEDCRLSPNDIGYINAHGTSTPLGDLAETKAVKSTFGEYARKLALSSTKSQLGHLLGASGGVEAVITSLAVHRNLMPPTINLENPDPDCDLDYVPLKARDRKVDYAMSNSFGFGGHNASLLLKKVS